MTPKIFATEVKKPVNRLCRPEGGGKRKERKKKEEKRKKRKEASAHFPDSIPLCHSSSFFLPLFIILSATDLFLSSPLLSPPFSPPFPPFSSPRLHIFPPFSLDGSIDIDRLWNVVVVRTSPRFSPRPFSRVFSKLRSRTPPPPSLPPCAYRVRVKRRTVPLR